MTSIAVHKVAKAVADCTPLAVSTTGKVVNPRVLNLLIDPVFSSGVMTQVVEDLHWSGISFVILVGSPEYAPTSIVHIDADKVSYIKNSYGDITQVQVFNTAYSSTFTKEVGGTHDGKYLNVNKTAEIVLISMNDERPILAKVATENTILRQSLERNGALVQNGGKLSMLISFKDDADAEEIQRRTDEIKRITHSHSYGGIMATGSAEITEYGLKPRDTDYPMLVEQCSNAIYSACGIPLSLVTTSASTYNNVSTGEHIFYNDTVIPLANFIYSAFSKALNKRKDVLVAVPFNILVDTADIDALKFASAELAKAFSESGILTVDETRAILGYPALQDSTLGNALVSTL